MDAGADLRPIGRVAVIGAGRAGAAFTRDCIRAGYEVVLTDVLPERMRMVHALVASDGDASAGSLRLADTVEDAVRTADVMVDFVPDELESKLEIWSMADRMAPPHMILCTPTSAMSVSDLASCVYRPERCVAVGQMMETQVTLMTHSGVLPAVVDAVGAMLRRMGRLVSVVADTAEPMLTKNVGSR